jgi:hypothetical protein
MMNSKTPRFAKEIYDLYSLLIIHYSLFHFLSNLSFDKFTTTTPARMIANAMTC